MAEAGSTEEAGDAVEVVRMTDRSADAETVSHWIYDHWKRDSAEEISRWLLKEGSECPPALLARSAGEPVGALAFKRFRSPDPEDAGSAEQALWINVIYVHEDWRRRGVGSRLHDYGVAAAREYGGEHTLFVYTDIPRFYEDRGWKEVGHQFEKKYSVLKLDL